MDVESQHAERSMQNVERKDVERTRHADDELGRLPTQMTWTSRTSEQWRLTQNSDFSLNFSKMDITHRHDTQHTVDEASSPWWHRWNDRLPNIHRFSWSGLLWQQICRLARWSTQTKQISNCTSFSYSSATISISTSTTTKNSCYPSSTILLTVS